MSLYLGIDPGLDGAIGVIDEQGNYIRIYDTPIIKYQKGKKKKREYDIPAIRNILINFSDTGPTKITLGLEKMQSLPPGIRIQASFSLGLCQGIFEGLLVALNIPYQLVIPKTWQKEFQITKPKGDKKAQSMMIAEKLFPTAELRGPKGGKKDGRSDALLIAEWMRRKNEQRNT